MLHCAMMTRANRNNSLWGSLSTPPPSVRLGQLPRKRHRMATALIMAVIVAGTVGCCLVRMLAISRQWLRQDGRRRHLDLDDLICEVKVRRLVSKSKIR